jgi:DNA invertase Pin-like site-specific DNA recombinase
LPANRRAATNLGYARVSTVDQRAGFDAQIRELEAAGVERIFEEKVSSIVERPQLEQVLDWLREGDVLTVTRLDRLARSTRQLLEIAERVKSKGAALRVLNLGDTGTATGQLVFTVIGAIAEFERRLMLERQREGIAAAKIAGKYKGRIPTARRKADEVRALDAQGVDRAEIARRLGMGRTSVYRCLGLVRDEVQGEARK